MAAEAEFTHHEPCPSCGSSDALARYTDGHGYCFSCQYHEQGNESVAKTHSIPADSGSRPGLLLHGDYRPLSKRGITEETCRKFGYRVAEFQGRTVQVADYHDSDGNVVAQKVRFPDKDFTVLGDMKKAGLFGQQLWRDTGKMIVVTEGEIDALSVSQLQQNKWAVVSIPNGAQGAVKAIKKSLTYLSGFASVILMFDMDEPGREAAREAAELFAPGQCKIASLPLKDANEMLQAQRGGEVINAIWSAKTYRPDGIVAGVDLWDAISKDDDKPSLPYPWPMMLEKTCGLRRGELVTLTAGTGIGKSIMCREIAHHLMKLGETVGYIALEENVKRTALGLIGIEMNKPLHIDRERITQDELQAAFRATVGSGRCYLYDHFGSSDIDNLLSRVRYLAKGCDCGWIILDHLSIIVSGLGDGDERRLIDNAMTALRTLVEETGIGLILVSHLKRPEGKGHEDGAQTSLSQLRGSQAIAQLSDMVIGAERDQQSERPTLMTVRVLKNRFSGDTGEVGYLDYHRETGRLQEASPFQEEVEQPF